LKAYMTTETISERQVCIHAFIGLLGNGVTVAIYQIFPWDMVGWHSGGGSKGAANNMGYIGFEICEDGLADAAYFIKVCQEVAELCAMLVQDLLHRARQALHDPPQREPRAGHHQ
jgi:hypothetical protein